jgi:hypothetical protein
VTVVFDPMPLTTFGFSALAARYDLQIQSLALR